MGKYSTNLNESDMTSKNDLSGSLRSVVKDNRDYRKELKQWKANEEELQKLRAKNSKALSDAERKRKEELLALEEEHNNRLEAIKDKKAKDRLEAEKDFSKEASAALSSGLKSLKSTLESTMTSFLTTQTSMAYGLTGTGRNLKGVTDKLTSALAGTGLVKQEAVYNNLNKLVQSGIVYNVEQRAFLQTLSDDLGAMFNAENGSLLRLINLQRVDLTSQRMAIQTSLKEFLNQNYETSLYIKEGFESVSASLLEAQATMTAEAGMDLEATVQAWLGSLSSVGMSDSTVQALAAAIGLLGSGNISALSSNSMQNLLVMGAAQTGQSYADLLTYGVSAQQADLLMQGIVNYIAQIGNNQSNVVRSEYARIFGLNISDILAASQLGNISGVYDTETMRNINNFLGKADEYVYTTTKMNNLLSNFMYEWATGVASSPANYMIYKVSDIVANAVSAMTAGVTTSIKLFGTGIDLNLSEMVQAAPLLTTIPSLLGTLGNGIFNMASGTNAASIFERLGAGYEDSMKIATAGLLTGFTKQTGMNTSGSMLIMNTSSGDVANTAMTSAADVTNETIKSQDEMYDTTDIYKYLTDTLTDAILEDLPEILATQTYATVAEINQQVNTVTIGNDLTYALDLMVLSTMNIQNIYNILVARFTNQETFNVIDTGEYNWNHSLSWTTNPAAGMGQAVNVPTS